MIKLLLASAAALCLWGCVTTADLVEFSDIQNEAIESIAQAQREHQDAVEALLADGTKTDEEIIEGLAQLAKEREAVVKAIAEETGQSVEELIKAIETRTKAVVGSAGTLTGNALIDLLLSTLLGAAGGAAGVNRIRDHRRLVRGEPVGVQPSST